MTGRGSGASAEASDKGEARIVSMFSRVRRGTTHDRLTVKQGEAKVEQVVQVGKRLFAELGERTTLLEAEVQLYREAVIALARRAGVEVPAFARADSGGGGKGAGGNVEELRVWLGRVLSGPLAVEEMRMAE